MSNRGEKEEGNKERREGEEKEGGRGERQGDSVSSAISKVKS